MMYQPIQLSLEQEFNIRAFEVEVQHMPPEKVQAALKKLYRYMIVRETMYKQLLKHQWNC
jgi:hypothetical protein